MIKGQLRSKGLEVLSIQLNMADDQGKFRRSRRNDCFIEAQIKLKFKVNQHNQYQRTDYGRNQYQSNYQNQYQVSLTTSSIKVQRPREDTCVHGGKPHDSDQRWTKYHEKRPQWMGGRQQRAVSRENNNMPCSSTSEPQRVGMRVPVEKKEILMERPESYEGMNLIPSLRLVERNN